MKILITSLSFTDYIVILKNYRIENSTHCSVKLRGLKFGLSSKFSEFFDKVPDKILLDVLFRVFRVSRGSFNALAS